MYVYVVLAVVFGLAWNSLRLLWKGGVWQKVTGGLLALFLALYAPWFYLTIHLRLFFLISAGAVFALGFLRKGEAVRATPRKGFGRFLWPALLALLNILWYTGTAPQPAGIAELSFPLKHGRYVVQQGGHGLPTNIFHVSARGASYAIDMVRLNRWGARANKPFSERLEDYAVFGDTVYAPLAGTVQNARSENPDNTPPRRERGPSNLNAVVIAGEDCTVFLGHLRQDGVLVQEGEVVRAGDPIGLVGNSGMSIEPHLHIQAHQRTDGPWWSAPPMLIRFDGEEYRLGQVIHPREVPIVAQ